MDEAAAFQGDVGTDHDHDHEQVGTVDVQILLSWFFETADPAEIAFDLPEAA